MPLAGPLNLVHSLAKQALTRCSVTGSSRGIGAAIALRLAAHGVDVVINYVASAAEAEKVAHQAREQHGVKAITIQADVSDEQDVARLFTETKIQLGKVDIVMVS